MSIINILEWLDQTVKNLWCMIWGHDFRGGETIRCSCCGKKWPAD